MPGSFGNVTLSFWALYLMKHFMPTEKHLNAFHYGYRNCLIITPDPLFVLHSGTDRHAMDSATFEAGYFP